MSGQYRAKLKITGLVNRARSLFGRDGKTEYEFEVAVLGSINKHFRYTMPEMGHIYTGPDGTVHRIKPENLYRVKPTMLDRLRYKLKGIASGFIVVFKTDTSTPITYEAPEYSARVLRTISESRALKTALKDEFAKAMDTKTLFMYFLLIAGAVVVYLFMTGQLSV